MEIMSAIHSLTLGLIVGNRGFFPASLCKNGRTKIMQRLKGENIEIVALSLEDTRYGSIESLAEAQRCADLFKNHRDEIDGVLITLPNFGDERAIANALRWSGLNVSILVHAFPDELSKMNIEVRRDSFCGKISVCNNLRQYGIKYSLTEQHTEDPDGEEFKADLQRFAACCRVVRGLKNARFGMVGARPAAFNTVRFSEKILEHAGISVETLDLSEVLGQTQRIKNDDLDLIAKLEEIQGYTNIERVPKESLLRMAKLGLVIDRWIVDKNLVGTTIQCWTALQEYYGIVPCALMSMMSNKLMPSACEADIAGVISMYAMTLASGKPSAIVDWNNNYGTDLNKAVVFHCSNFPKEFFTTDKGLAPDSHVMDFQEIIANDVGKENAYGTIVGRVKSSPFTFCRVSTDDENGKIKAYVGEGEVTNDPMKTFGGYGIVQIPNMQELLKYICKNGFEHHVVMNLSKIAPAMNEAMNNYFGWDVHYHE